MTTNKPSGPTRRAPSIRISVTFPREQYDIMCRIARDKKVSVAWVAREAVEQYLARQWPLLGGGEP